MQLKVNLVDEIKNFFIKNKLTIKKQKIKLLKTKQWNYKVHQSKPFYNDLCSYLSSGPIVVMILEGGKCYCRKSKINGRY